MNSEMVMKDKVKEIANSYLHLLQQTHDQALLNNEIQKKRWEDYCKEHEELSTRLLSMRDKLSHEMMVPIGKKVLMRGKLVHTNEILTSLGDGWFIKQSAKQAADMCQRRIQHCDEMLKKLKKEEELLTSRKNFGLDKEVWGLHQPGENETQEVIEPYDEEAEKEWRVKHRQKEREYRQKLAELKKTQKSKIETEEDLWSRLDALDLQEELEDELNRLSEDDSESESNEESSQSNGNETSESEDNSESEKEKTSEEKSERLNHKPLKRRVSFKENIDTNIKQESLNEIDPSVNDSIHITFNHSDVPSAVVSSRGDKISTPADIYYQYIQQKQPKSILKASPSVEPQLDLQEDSVLQSISSDCSDIKHNREQETLHEPLVQAIGEVVEHNPVSTSSTVSERPVSRFKAARMANKR